MPTSWSSLPPARCCTRSWAVRSTNSSWVRFQSYCRGRVQRRFAPVRHEQKDLYDALLGAGLKRVCEKCAVPQPPRLRDSDLFPTLPSTPRLHRKIRKRALVGMEKRSVVRAEFSAAAEEKLPSSPNVSPEGEGSGEKQLDLPAERAHHPEIIVRAFPGGLALRPHPECSDFLSGQDTPLPQLGVLPQIRLPTACLSAAQSCNLQLPVHLAEQLEMRIARRQRHPNLAYGDANLGPDLEQLQSHRVALRLGQFGTRQPQPPQALHQQVGHGGKVEPDLIAPHPGRAGAIGKQHHLFLDPVSMSPRAQ